MIEVSDLTKKYGDNTAVSHLSFTVGEGQVYGFLGPNGAGKTTTMNVMTGYLAATEGTVSIDGHDIFEEPELAKQQIGYLPEQPPLYSDMTAREYLRFLAELKKVDKKSIDGEISRVVGVTGTADVQNRLIKFLSKGYRQRVGLAGALIGSPKVLILDEPTVGLDPKQVVEIRSLIKELGRTHTVIFSSHILSEVSSICDTVLIISHGRLVACDTPSNLAKMMSDSSVIEAVVIGEKKTLRRALENNKKIKELKINEMAEGKLSVHIKMKEGEDIRGAVSKAIVSSGCVLLSMEMSTMSLEEVFLQLTSDEKEGKA